MAVPSGQRRTPLRKQAVPLLRLIIIRPTMRLVVNEPEAMRFQVNRATLVDPQILELRAAPHLRRLLDLRRARIGSARAGRLQDAHRLRPAGHLLPRQQEPGARVPQHLPPPRRHGLPRAEGNAKRYTCFYHGWSYDRDGELDGVPGRGRLSAALRARAISRLKEPPRVASYRGFVFLNFDADAMPLEDYLAGAKEYIDLVVDQSPSGRDGGDPGHCRTTTSAPTGSCWSRTASTTTT